MRSNLSASFPPAVVRVLPAAVRVFTNHFTIFLFSLFFGCGQKEAVKEAEPTTEPPVFKNVSSAHSGVTFKNHS